MKKVIICQGSRCISRSVELFNLFADEIRKNSFVLITDPREIMDHLSKTDLIYLSKSGCMGLCSEGPFVAIEPTGVLYTKVFPDNVRQIVTETLRDNKIVESLLFTDPVSGEKCRSKDDIKFFKHQKRNILADSGEIDPEYIGDYIVMNGYTAESKAYKELSPEQIIEIIKLSGLRGRGGGGFQVGLKWELGLKSESKEKYLICNANDGTPASYKDISILESSPHLVLEGMAICAKAVGANTGYVYINQKNTVAVRRVSTAIQQAETLSLLGKEILETDFDFELNVVQGTGGLISGEETALINFMEGKPGVPDQRPPYPAEKGFHGNSTIINNAETFANIPKIIEKGADWFLSSGTGKSKGTKVLTVYGDVLLPGIVEVPMGITLREIIFDICGGTGDNKKIKAVQVGGMTGVLLPETMLDTIIDYESLTETGTIMGSGAIYVINEDICIIKEVKQIMEKITGESCGKCAPCRIGTTILLKKLSDICNGKGEDGDIDLLESMSRNIKASSLCGLGKTAPNPVMTSIRYFRHEYEMHIIEKKCPSSKCRM